MKQTSLRLHMHTLTSLFFVILITAAIMIAINSCGGGETETKAQGDVKVRSGVTVDFGDDKIVTGVSGYPGDEVLAALALKAKNLPGGSYVIGTNDKRFPDRWPNHEVKMNAFLLVDTPLSVNLYSKFIQYCDPYKNKSIKYDLNLKIKDYEAILARDKRDWLSYEKDATTNVLKVTATLWADAGWDFIQKNNIKAPLGWPEPNKTSEEYRKFIDENKEFPVRGVSYYEAEACCRSFGVRLPSEEEFEAAASAGENVYPWGNEMSEKEATASWNDKGPDTAGNYQKGRTKTNLADMTGGIQQWTTSEYKLYYDPEKVDDQFLKQYAKENDKLGKGYIVTRGSSYVNVDYNKTVYYRLPLPKDTRDDRVGFRLCHSDLDYVKGLWQQEEKK